MLFRNKNSNDLLEKALTGEIIQLNEPPEVLSSTSINITWKIFKSEFLIEGFYIKYKPIGSKTYLTETLVDNKAKHHVLKHLDKFTAYEILMEPFSGQVKGSESNIVQAKTREDAPTHSPTQLSVELDTTKSVSIKWQPPPFTHMNGIVLGYKIACLTNETKSSLNLNTNATTRAIILGNLIEGLRYCFKVAAYTRMGTGPFTASKCLEMSEAALNAQHEIKADAKTSATSLSFADKLKELVSQPWFIVCAALAFSVCVFLAFYGLFWRLKRGSFKKKKKHTKYMSSSENCSLNGPHKVDNGNRYKLVNDTIWLDTLHSSSNNSNPECCCVPDLHHQLFLHQSKYLELTLLMFLR